MPLRFQNVCRHRQTNNTGRLPPILTPHALFSHLSCRASLKFTYLSRKSPAGRLPPILTPHTLFSHFPAALLSSLPTFPENPLPAVFRRSSHRTRCFLTFRSCSPLPCLTFSYHHFKSSPSPSPHNSFLNLSQHSK